MKTRQNLPIKKQSAAMTAAKVVMLVLTAVYPLFMTLMTAAGILTHRSSYGSYVTGMAVLLIVSGVSVTTGVILALPRKKMASLVSLSPTFCGLTLCLVTLSRLSAYADKHGWTASGMYSGTAVSDMYQSRLLPVVFPAAIAVVVAVIQAFFCDCNKKNVHS